MQRYRKLVNNILLKIALANLLKIKSLSNVRSFTSRNLIQTRWWQTDVKHAHPWKLGDCFFSMFAIHCAQSTSSSVWGGKNILLTEQYSAVIPSLLAWAVSMHGKTNVVWTLCLIIIQRGLLHVSRLRNISGRTAIICHWSCCWCSQSWLSHRQYLRFLI